MDIKDNISSKNENDLINDNGILTENEKLILDLIRRGEEKSITINFADGKPISLELLRKKKVHAEARIQDVLQKHKYQELVIKTADGNIAYSTIRTQIRLEK